MAGVVALLLSEPENPSSLLFLPLPGCALLGFDPQSRASFITSFIMSQATSVFPVGSVAAGSSPGQSGIAGSQGRFP